MKKAFFLLGVTLLFCCTVAQADITKDGMLRTTNDADKWQVAYWGGAQTQNGVSDENFDWKAARNGNEDKYSTASAVSTQTANSKNWSSSDKLEGLNWISSDASTVGKNGYYSYLTTVTDIVGDDWRYNGLAINYASDDHLHAIIVNGVILDFDAEGANHSGWTANLVTLFFDDIDWNMNGENTIEFIVHNNNSGGSFKKDDNPTGFVSSVQAAYILPDGSVSNIPVTPEPATMLIFGLAGLAGLPVARKYRKK